MHLSKRIVAWAVCVQMVQKEWEQSESKPINIPHWDVNLKGPIWHSSKNIQSFPNNAQILLWGSFVAKLRSATCWQSLRQLIICLLIRLCKQWGVDKQNCAKQIAVRCLVKQINWFSEMSCHPELSQNQEHSVVMAKEKQHHLLVRTTMTNHNCNSGFEPVWAACYCFFLIRSLRFCVLMHQVKRLKIFDGVSHAWF